MKTRPVRPSDSYKIVAALPLLAVLSGCDLPLALDPRGPAAAEIARIWWILLWTAVVVSVAVFGLLAAAIVRARGRARAEDRAGGPQLDRPGSEDARGERRTTAFVLIAGGVVPTVILIGATILTLSGLAVFDQPRDDAATTVVVRGHMFWWEVEYPDHGVVTANEIHVPVGQPVRVELESADVIHSFWVPQLHGKLEMVPGRTNVIHMEADEAGTYFGKCAEFCGPQHANMEMLFIAQPQAEFEAWLASQAADAAEPTSELARRGREVFVASPCSACHTIRGVSTAAAEVGPDLTHLATRETLAARTLPNVRGNLGGWILDPQGIKPGNKMPAVALDAEDFLALLEYLGGLQ